VRSGQVRTQRAAHLYIHRPACELGQHLNDLMDAPGRPVDSRDSP
jgi:hypothetical protein